MNINELIQKAHANAKAKGFWDGERNTGELLMLIVSECGEALEAHRKGRMGTIKDCPQTMTWVGDSPILDKDRWREDFERVIKDGFFDELADIVIRIADLLGDIEYVCEHEPNDMERGGNVGEALLYVTKMVCEDHPRLLCGAMMEVFGIAKAHNIDLWLHIKLKMAYNETRERLHGKSY